jgi:hypothetical protein
MTFDKFIRRSQLISSHMEAIAQRMAGFAPAGGLTPIHHPLLRDVLAAQERLLTAAEKLLDATARLDERARAAG